MTAGFFNRCAATYSKAPLERLQIEEKSITHHAAPSSTCSDTSCIQSQKKKDAPEKGNIQIDLVTEEASDDDVPQW